MTTKLKIRGSNTRKESTTKTSAIDRPVARSVKKTNYAFAKAGVVPSGRYIAHIDAVENSTAKSSGAESVDILSTLRNNTGQNFHVRMRYPLDSIHFDNLCDALIDAGLAEGQPLSKAVGIEEVVLLDYADGERIGSFVDRKPIDPASTTSAVAEDEDAPDDDDEFDDFLSDVDDDDEDSD